MQTCLLRMAETRAKARALRDAVNIGVAAFEELGDDDAHDGAPERGYAVGAYRNARPERPAPPARSSNGNGTPVRPAAAAAKPAPEPESGTGERSEPRPEVKKLADDSATETQLEAIRSLCRRQSVDPEAAAKERFGTASLATLTHAQASDMIRELNGRPAGRAAAVA